MWTCSRAASTRPYRQAELDHSENFEHDDIKGTFQAMLNDWVNEEFDPFASPQETGSAYGVKNGQNLSAVSRDRVTRPSDGGASRRPTTAQRRVRVPGQPDVRRRRSGRAARRGTPGYEAEVSSFNFFSYLSRSDVTWNPSVVSVCRDRLDVPDHRGVHPADHPRQ